MAASQLPRLQQNVCQRRTPCNSVLAMLFWKRAAGRRAKKIIHTCPVCQAVCNGSQRCNPTSRAEEGLAGSVLQGFFLCHSHTAAPPTSISPTISATSGRMQARRMQAEQHRSALPWRLRSTAPRCPQVPFRRQPRRRQAPTHPPALSASSTTSGSLSGESTLRFFVSGG